MNVVYTKIRFVWIENLNLLIFKKLVFLLALKQKIWFLKKKRLGMKNKTFMNECKCVHCQQKINQINNSKLYWDKLFLRKMLS
jgi:hypothetical protein